VGLAEISFVISSEVEKKEFSESSSKLEAKQEEIYPAIEANPSKTPLLYPVHDSLGYSSKKTQEGPIYTFPDREALLANWCAYQKDNPDLNLPDLDIVTGEGTADDLDYFLSSLSHDLFLSEGKEFFHDSFAHALVITLRIHTSAKIKPGDSKAESARLAKLMFKYYRRLLIAKKMSETNPDLFEDKNTFRNFSLLLGYIADVAANRIYTMDWDSELIEKLMKNLWDNPDLRHRIFFERRFGTARLSEVPFHRVWTQLKKVERQYDASRKKSQNCSIL
jgi:hypothetical protein